MYAQKTCRLVAAAALFSLMAGAASAAPAKSAAPVAPPPSQAKMTPAQPVVVLIGTASLEEYHQSDPAGRTEITRATLAQRPAPQTPRPAGSARS